MSENLALACRTASGLGRVALLLALFVFTVSGLGQCAAPLETRSDVSVHERLLLATTARPESEIRVRGLAKKVSAGCDPLAPIDLEAANLAADAFFPARFRPVEARTPRPPVIEAGRQRAPPLA